MIADTTFRRACIGMFHSMQRMRCAVGVNEIQEGGVVAGGSAGGSAGGGATVTLTYARSQEVRSPWVAPSKS